MSTPFENTQGFERLKNAMRNLVNLPKAEVERIQKAVKPPPKKRSKRS